MRTSKRNRNGTGSIYRERGRGRSANFMMRFYDLQGIRFQFSTGTADAQEVQKVLNEQLARVAQGLPVDKATVGRKVWKWEDAVKLHTDRMEADGLTSRDQTSSLIARRITPFFKGMLLTEITTDQVTAYQASRLKEQAAVATVNVELAALRRILKLAQEAGKLKTPMPAINLANPHNARRGFFERDHFDAVIAQLKKHGHDWLVGPSIVAYYTGWRMASEILTIEGAWVDL